MVTQTGLPNNTHTHTPTSPSRYRLVTVNHSLPPCNPTTRLSFSPPPFCLLEKSSCRLSLPSSSHIFFSSSASFCQKSSSSLQLSTTGCTKNKRREAAPWDGTTSAARLSGCTPSRREEAATVAHTLLLSSLVSQLVGRCAAPMLKDHGAAFPQGRCGMSGSTMVSSLHQMTLGCHRSEGWAVAVWAGGQATALTCHPRRPTSPSAPSSSRRSPKRSP